MKFLYYTSNLTPSCHLAQTLLYSHGGTNIMLTILLTSNSQSGSHSVLTILLTP